MNATTKRTLILAGVGVLCAVVVAVWVGVTLGPVLGATLGAGGITGILGAFLGKPARKGSDSGTVGSLSSLGDRALDAGREAINAGSAAQRAGEELSQLTAEERRKAHDIAGTADEFDRINAERRELDGKLQGIFGNDHPDVADRKRD